MTREGSTRFVVLAVVAGSLMIGLGVAAPLIPLFITEFDASPRFIGLLLASFPLGRFLGSYPGGWATDHLGFRTVGTFSCLGAGVAGMVAGVFLSPVAMVIGLFAMGGATAFYAAGASAYVLENAERERAGRVMSTYQTLALLGMAAGPVFGAVTATRIDLRAPFVLYALLAVVGSLVTRAIVAPRPQAKPAPMSGVGAQEEPVVVEDVDDASRRRVFQLLWFAAIVLFWNRSGPINTLTPIFAYERLGLDVETIGYALTAGLVMTVLVVRHAGTLADRGHSRTLLVWFSAVLAVCMALFGLVTEPWQLFGLLLVFGLCTGYLLVAPQVMLLAWSKPGRIGRTVGAHRTASSLGLVVGALTTGELVAAGFVREGFFLSAGVLAIGSVAMLAMPTTLPPGHPVSSRSA